MLSVNDATIVTRNEDVSDFIIGYFGDGRLQKIAALLFKKISKKMTTCTHKLSSGRAMQVAFSRLLSNEKFTKEEIEESLAKKTNENCMNKKHVLCVQDTIEVNYSSQPTKKAALGVNRNKKEGENGVKGFLAHPGLIIDAEHNDILGLSSVKVWTRSNDDNQDKKSSGIEDKESYKWIETAESAKKNITKAETITVIGDRESDIYELFDRTPNEDLHLIVRSRHNRGLTTGESIDEHMMRVSPAGRYEIHLPAITGVRKARNATIEVKYSSIEIGAPSQAKSTTNSSSNVVNCVEACEISTPPGKGKPIVWRLLSTHRINNFLEAKQIITWYSWRWNIEQVFRTMKKKGFKIEDCEVENIDALLKIFILAIASAVKVLCLVNARDGRTSRMATDMFSEEEMVLLGLVLRNVNGKTKKQQNHHKQKSLAWASWIIARLGGWNGCACESPPGPITIYSGLETFYKYLEGWKLAQQDVCIG
ncbi:MAG: IS4 family transposase [Porticoccaceae bacterium]